MALDTGTFEQGLLKLAQNYGRFYGDRMAHFGAASWDQILDAETFEMLYVQESKDEKLPCAENDWKGKTCYNYYYGRSERCEDCYSDMIGKDHFHVCTKKFKYSDDLFIIESIAAEYENRPVIFQKAINITDPVYKDVVAEAYIKANNLLNLALGILMEETPITDNFKNVCRIINDFFGADRTQITEYWSGKLSTMYSAEGVLPYEQISAKLSDDGIRDVTKATSSLNYIWVPDTEKADNLPTALRERWAKSGIKSVFFVPMTYNGSFVGALSLHNITRNISSVDVLKLVAMGAAKSMHAYIAEEKADRHLYTDPLTGAPNMAGLQRKSRELFMKYPENRYSVCIIDIKFFGALNRRYGFELGDRVLIEAARRIGEGLGEDETFCRISKDMFCVMAKAEHKQLFDFFADKMQCFEELAKDDYKIEFQAGVYIMRGEKNIGSAIDKASLAIKSLKDAVGSHIAFFSDEMLERNRIETELLQDFRHALNKNEFEVYYQPQCSYSLQKIVGAEALVRWKSAKHGDVSPADFIPLFERHGLVYELDRYVWEEVCKNQRRWIDKGFECPISINMSRHDVLKANICEELCGLLEKYNVPKRLIPLEITETAYIKNTEELIAAVDRLKDAGFTVEMDDFGSGYSSLNALKDVSVDLLKLDMKFLDMGVKTAKGNSILSCIVRMTRWLELAVLAEGVETAEQAEYLKNIGCDLMQGFYFARPMPAKDYERMLMTIGTDENSELQDSEHRKKSFMQTLMSNPMLFSSIGAAALIEYDAKTAEALMVNDSFLEILGMGREECKQYMKDLKNFVNTVLDPPDIFSFDVNNANFVQAKNCRVKRKNGTSVQVDMIFKTLQMGGGRVVKLVILDEIENVRVNA